MTWNRKLLIFNGNGLLTQNKYSMQTNLFRKLYIPNNWKTIKLYKNFKIKFQNNKLYTKVSKFLARMNDYWATTLRLIIFTTQACKNDA